MCQVIFMATITTSDELRLFNRSRILSCLRTGGRQSRTALCESTGLSASTVSQVTGDLIDDGVIELVAPVRSAATSGNGINNRRGRPQVLLQLNSHAATTAVITFLLNEFEVSLYDYAGQRIHRVTKRVATERMSLATLKKHLFGLLDSALEAGECETSLQHIAMVCQGTVARDNSQLLWSPITKLKNVDLRGILQQRYDVTVNVANDCNMIARAIYNEHQTAGSVPLTGPTTSTDNLNDNFAVILSSYGIGLGYFHQGKILTGSYSSGAEFGHMLFKADGALCRCGRKGCIEAYASDYAIWRRANGKPLDSEPADVVPEGKFAELLQEALEKPGPARAAFEEAGAAIGQGLSNLFAIFDPFPAMLVGITPDAFSLMQKSLLADLRHYGVDETDGTISIYDRATERKLIRDGATLRSLEYIDERIFGFGGSARVGVTTE